jgi:hypothetical protein
MKVSADQFELRGDKLTHVPTGSEFWAGETDVVLCDKRSTLSPTASGDDYSVEDLKRMAWEIFQQEKATCV